MPWYLIIAAKIVLSRIPVSYQSWAKLGIFKLGKMADTQYAIKIFFLHWNASFNGLNPQGKVMLEMGSGDSAASALIAAAMGAKKIYLLDAGDYATKDMTFYCKLAMDLRERGLNPPYVDAAMDFSDFLDVCRAEYLTEGLNSWKRIPDASIDYAWSHSTLEHIRKGEFRSTIAALYRAMTTGGVTSHNIDLKDHLGGNLNNLRFSKKIWESDWMTKSGFYTNRLRASEIKNIFDELGFITTSSSVGAWDSLPTRQTKMANPFSEMMVDDLLIRSLAVVLTKPACH